MHTTLIGLLGFALAWTIARRIPLEDGELVALFVFLPAASMAVFEWLHRKVHRRSTTGLQFDHRNSLKGSLQRTAVKTLAYWSMWALVAAYYWLLKDFPYQKYSSYYDFLRLVLPYAVLASPLYIFYVDRRQINPTDGALEFGRILLRLGENGKLTDSARTFILSHVLRAFFLPPLAISLVNNFKSSNNLTLSAVNFDLQLLFYWYFDKIFMIDVVFGVAGYFIASRLLDNHVRGVYKNTRSYIFTLVCYAPYNVVFFTPSHFYEVGRYWDSIIPVDSYIGVVWMSAICLASTTVVLSDISFGLRFSNLTDRGINTSGPYAFFKHPAYFAKNVSWWFMYVPFLSLNNPYETIRSCLLMIFLNFIYYQRAKCEQSELMRLEKYRDYVAYIELNGAVAHAKRFAAKVFDSRKI